MSHSPEQMYATVRNDYQCCIDKYRETSDSWFIGWAVDMEQKVSINGWEESQSVDDDDTITSYMKCPLDGVINVVHAFEAQTFVPIKGSLVTVSIVTQNNYGRSVRKNISAPIAQATTNDEGVAQFDLSKTECVGKKIAVNIEADVSDSDLETLFSSYDSLIERSLNWLDGKWQGEQLGAWADYLQNPMSAVDALEKFLDQVLDAIKDVWDDLKMIFQLLTQPEKMYNMVKKFCDPAQLAQLLEASKAEMAKMLILLQDEARLFLCINAVYSWCRTLTPNQVIVIAGAALAAILVDTILNLIMPGGIFRKVLANLGSTEKMLDAMT